MIRFVHPYSPEVREIVLRCKENRPSAIAKVAEEMARIIPRDAVIVPMPSHGGRPTYSLSIACAISRITAASICTALSGEPRRSQYEVKKEGGLLSGDDFGLKRSSPLLAFRSFPLLGKIVIIDDVIGTGETVKAALKVFPQADVAVYSMDTETFKKHNKDYEIHCSQLA